MSDVYHLRETFGNIDIYLFDQLLRRRITPGMAVFDVGCGHGRNIQYLMSTGHPVFAIDEDGAAITAVRALARAHAPHLPPDNFRVESIEATSFPAEIAELVICSAVFHFARDPTHFEHMVDGAWERVKRGGVFFARLASTAGIESQVRPIGDGRFALPDGSERFLVDADMLASTERRVGAERLDPLKTTLVHGMRSMTTWVLRKPD